MRSGPKLREQGGNSVGAQLRGMESRRRKAVQSIRDLFGGDATSFFKRFAKQEFCEYRTGGDGGDAFLAF